MIHPRSGHIIRSAVIAAAIFFVVSDGRAKDAAEEHPPKISVAPAEALSRLKVGNRRFVSSNLAHPRQSSARREKLAQGQAPFAVVLACADSRTPPEVIFDQGLGDLFVVRVAGNISTPEVLGSIEYAVEHLGTRLIIVLGHQKCGAVEAARDTIAANQQAPAHIDSLVAAIKPAVDETATGDLESTVKANVKDVVKILQTSEPLLKGAVDKKDIEVRGAYYNLATGAVTFLDAK